MIHAFKMYYRPVFKYLIEVYTVGKDHGFLTFISAAVMAVYHFIVGLSSLNVFGVPKQILIFVALTVAFNTYTGIKKSKIKAKRALRCVRKMGYANRDTDKYKACSKIFRDNKFDRKKMSFVYFKMFTFLGYLYFANTLVDTDVDNFLEEVLMLTSGLILRVPTVWFWYTEWKSIGENSVIIYNKKPKIFDITETIFEAKFLKHFKS